MRRGDEDVANIRHHQRAERILDHRLAVDRQKLLGDDAGQGVIGACRYPLRG